MLRYWKTNDRARGLVLMAFAAVGAAACGGGTADHEGQSALDRKLNLALEQTGAQAELSDIGPGAAAPIAREPRPAGEGASGASQGSPPPAPPEKPRRVPPPPVSLATAEAKLAPRAEVEPLVLPEMTASVPSGTTFQITLSQALNTEYNFPGDAFMATLAEPLMVGDHEVAPAGTEVLGRVTSVRAPNGSEDGVIEAKLERVFIGDASYPIDATVTQTTKGTRESTDNDGPGTGARVGQGALQGALLGSILGRSSKGTLVGAGIGAILGGTSGPGGGPGATVLAVGTELSCVLHQPLILPSITS